MTIGGGFFTTGDSGASAMPSSSFLQAAGCEREDIRSKCRYKLQRFTSHDMLMVGMEHSWWAAFGVWADPSTAAVPYELADNYIRENRNGTCLNTHTQQCTISQLKYTKRNLKGMGMGVRKVVQGVHTIGAVTQWCSTAATHTQGGGRCHPFTDCSGWPLVRLLFIHHQVAHLYAAFSLLGFPYPATGGGASVHPLREGSVKVAEILLGENEPNNPTNKDQDQHHLEVNKQTTPPCK